MTRGFALWAGAAAVLAVTVVAVTVAAFPRERTAVELPAISVPARPASLRPVPVVVKAVRARVGRTEVAVPSRGGAATIPRGAANAHAGPLGSRTPPRATARPAFMARRVAPRPVSIGGQSGPNADSGLATGSP